MSNDDAWLLLKHMLEYTNDKNPEPPNTVVDLVFEPIKQQLKRDLEKWRDETIKRSEAGKKWMKSRRHNSDSNAITSITNDNTVINAITNISDNVNVNDNVNDTLSKGGERKRFTVPTLDLVNEYCNERSNGIDPEAFINHYESKWWMIGKNKMKDWKACVRTREQKRKETQKAQEPQTMDQWVVVYEKMWHVPFRTKYGSEKATEVKLYSL